MKPVFGVFGDTLDLLVIGGYYGEGTRMRQQVRLRWRYTAEVLLCVAGLLLYRIRASCVTMSLHFYARLLTSLTFPRVYQHEQSVFAGYELQTFNHIFLNFLHCRQFCFVVL